MISVEHMTADALITLTPDGHLTTVSRWVEVENDELEVSEKFSVEAHEIVELDNGNAGVTVPTKITADGEPTDFRLVGTLMNGSGYAAQYEAD